MLKFKHYVQGDNDEKNGYGNDFFTRMAQFTGMISIVVVVLLVGSLFFTANRISEVRKDAISKSRNFMVRKSCDKKTFVRIKLHSEQIWSKLVEIRNDINSQREKRDADIAQAMDAEIGNTLNNLVSGCNSYIIKITILNN